jgi:phosphomannomutase
MTDENVGNRDWLKEARAWLADDPDPGTRDELEEILRRHDPAELRERFASRLEFGTAGLRGVLGAGPNRMNRALVRQVTAGLARYLLDTLPDAARRGVVVGRDGRRMSRAFAEDTVAVLTAAGIPAHLFPDVIPTPITAFAVEALGAAAGIVVTASHNPPEYNGYKVYWENGAQIIPPHDTGISAAIDTVGPIAAIPVLELDEARRRGLLQDVPEEVGERYVKAVLALQRHPETQRDLKLVYTPLHGVGGAWVRRVFAAAGFSGPEQVPEQAEPDGEFPTVRFPNPEEKGAMDLALALAERRGADLVLANDPDADRLAVIVPADGGGYRPLTGNEIGTALAYYLLTEKPLGAGEPLVITTIVSSSLLRRMAAELGAHYRETLTGFKWIANQAIELKASRGYRFVFGFEEALGYTVGEVVRDKDGVGAALLFADLAAHCRVKNLSLLDYLHAIFRRFGIYTSAQKSLTLPGSEGLRTIGAIMETFRAEPPAEVAGVAVAARSDLRAGIKLDVATGRKEPLAFPASNVLVYDLEGGSRILLRPSGTEPKIKYYFEAVEPVAQGEPYADAEARAQTRLRRLMDGFQAEADRRTPR